MGTFDMDGPDEIYQNVRQPITTAVAMRFNSQHQSDKLPDKVVQPWGCHDGRQNKQTFRQDLIKPPGISGLLRFKLNSTLNIMSVPIFLKEKSDTIYHRPARAK